MTAPIGPATDAGGATTLSELSDAEVTTPSDGQILLYDNADARFENVSLSGDAILGGTGNITLITATDNFTFRDNVDATKTLNFELSGFTPSTARILTVPDASGTIALTSDIPGTFSTLNTIPKGDGTSLVASTITDMVR